jgi:hypothetical protein
MSKKLKRTISSTSLEEEENTEDHKIIYDPNYDQKQEDTEMSNIISENTNLIKPLSNIVNEYRRDQTGDVQYIVKRSIYESCDNEIEDTLCGIFNTFEKALIALLSIAYTNDRKYHIYDTKTKKWNFNIGGIGLNRIDSDLEDLDGEKLDLTNPLITLFADFHKYDYDDKYNETYIIEGYKNNYLYPNEINYALEYGELDDVNGIMDPQPKLVIDWLNQLKEYLNKEIEDNDEEEIEEDEAD